MREQSRTVDLTKGNVWGNIWHMSWSMLLVMFFNFLVGLTDVFIAGFLGPEIQAVVGFVSELYFFIIIVGNAISIGTVAMLSRAVGAGRFEDAHSTARQSILFGTVCSLTLMITGLILHDQIISIAGFSGDVREMARDFFVIYAFALVPNYIVILSNAVFRAGGEVRLTLHAMFYVTVINIALDFILVFGLFSLPELGFRGIAFSTAAAMYTGTAICFYLFRRSRWNTIFSGAWRFSFKLIRKIFILSWPMALLQAAWNIGNIILYNILGHLREGSITAMAAFTSGLRIEAIIYLPIFALNMAASVLTGQNLGAREPGRAETIGWKISLSGVAFVSLIALPIFIFAQEVSSPIAKDHMVLSETVRYLRIMMISEPFMAISLILGGSLQGAGDTKGVMFIIVISLWVIRLPLAYILAVTAGFGAPGVWTAMVISMCFQGIAMAARFRKGGWKEVRIWD